MSRIQSKITHHIKKKENLNSNEKIGLTDANTEMTQMLPCSDKDFQAAVINMLQQAMIKTLETN